MSAEQGENTESRVTAAGTFQALDEGSVRLALEPLLENFAELFQVAGKQRLAVNPQAGEDGRAKDALPVGGDHPSGGKVEPEQLTIFDGQDEILQHARCLVVIAL